MGAYPTFSEFFPTHLRATAVGVCVAFGRIGAIIGVVVLSETASSFGTWSAFLALAAGCGSSGLSHRRCGGCGAGRAAGSAWKFWPRPDQKPPPRADP
ncbi:MAG: hypothetical protein ACR2QA_09560 [Solirubrobacteraceae bacterium]